MKQLIRVHCYITSFSGDVARSRPELTALLKHAATSVEIRLLMGVTGESHGVIPLALVRNGNTVTLPSVQMVSML